MNVLKKICILYVLITPQVGAANTYSETGYIFNNTKNADMQYYKNLSLEDLPNEEWRDIECFEGLYQVSNLGRVKSLNRKGYDGRKLKSRILKISVERHGYIKATLSLGKPFQYKVHRLVAKAFIPNNKNNPQVNHINGVKCDNRVDNLEWCTASENIIHAFSIGLRKGISGELCSRAKFSKEQVKQFREHWNNGYSIMQVAKKFGECHKLLNPIFHNKSYPDKSYSPPKLNIVITTRKTMKDSISNIQAKEIRNLNNNGESMEIISRKYNVKRWVVSDIINNKTHFDENYFHEKKIKKKIDFALAEKIRLFYKEYNYLSKKEVAEKFNICHSSACKILNYETHKCSIA